jgi:hypothetical protein
MTNKSHPTGCRTSGDKRQLTLSREFLRANKYPIAEAAFLVYEEMLQELAWLHPITVAKCHV